MRIKDIRVILIRLPGSGMPLGGRASGPRELVVVEIETSSGLTFGRSSETPVYRFSCPT